MQGINVVPGVIDPDFAGEIKIIVQPTTKTVQIHSEHCAAQLLLLPYQISGNLAPQAELKPLFDILHGDHNPK